MQPLSVGQSLYQRCHSSTCSNHAYVYGCFLLIPSLKGELLIVSSVCSNDRGQPKKRSQRRRPELVNHLIYSTCRNCTFGREPDQLGSVIASTSQEYHLCEVNIHIHVYLLCFYPGLTLLTALFRKKAGTALNVLGSTGLICERIQKIRIALDTYTFNYFSRLFLLTNSFRGLPRSLEQALSSKA